MPTQHTIPVPSTHTHCQWSVWEAGVLSTVGENSHSFTKQVVPCNPTSQPCRLCQPLLIPVRPSCSLSAPPAPCPPPPPTPSGAACSPAPSQQAPRSAGHPHQRRKHARRAPTGSNMQGGGDDLLGRVWGLIALILVTAGLDTQLECVSLVTQKRSTRC